MTEGIGRQQAGTVIINGEPYLLARTKDGGAPEWHPMQVPTQEGDPTNPQRFRWRDWSRGLGDYRGIYKGAVATTSNAFLGKSGRILPGPKINEIATNHEAAITAIVPVTAPANRIISMGGRYTKEIDPADHTIKTTGDCGAGAVIMDAALFVDIVAIALGDSTDFYKRSAAGVYAANTISLKARAFGINSDGDLVRGYLHNWSKCSAADFYGTDNWSADYGLGDASGKINKVFGAARWDYVLKDEGFYTFDSLNSKESNRLPDLAGWKSSENRNWFPWYDRIMLCTYAGLYRYVEGGGTRTIGPEELEYNEGPLANCYPTAGAAFGKWAYVVFYDGTTSYLCMVRPQADGDASSAPFTITSIIDTWTGVGRAMLISSLSGAPILYYGAQVTTNHVLRYIKLTRDGKPSEYQGSGTCVVDFPPSDLGSPMTVKYMRSLEVVTRNLSAQRTLQFACAFDAGSFNNVGSALTAAGFGQAFWTKGTNDNGRAPQIRATMALDSTTTAPEIREVVANYEERPAIVPGAVVMLHFRGMFSEDGAASRKSAYEQRKAIEALLDGAIVDITDPDGETYSAALSAYRGGSSSGDIDYEFRDQNPQENMILVIRSLSYA